MLLVNDNNTMRQTDERSNVAHLEPISRALSRAFDEFAVTGAAKKVIARSLFIIISLFITLRTRVSPITKIILRASEGCTRKTHPSAVIDKTMR